MIEISVGAVPPLWHRAGKLSCAWPAAMQAKQPIAVHSRETPEKKSWLSSVLEGMIAI